MAICAIELNDYQLTLFEQDGHGQPLLTQQLGYALVDQDHVSFGSEAYKHAKASPENTYYHYWHRLGYEQINSSNASVRHFADLAYLQLQNLVSQAKACSQVVFIVPSHFSTQQLALLLGIAQSCQLEVIALVNSAVLSYEPSNSLHYDYYDIGLHSYEHSQLAVDGNITLRQSSQYTEKGIADLYSHLAAWLNQLFINQCRFDAFHLANHEQALYLQIATMLRKADSKYLLSIGDITIEVELRDLNNQISLFFNELIEQINQACEPVVMSQRFAAILSGLPINSRIQCHQPASNYQRVVALKDHLAQHYLNDDIQALTLVTSLPCPDTKTQPTEAANRARIVQQSCDNISAQIQCHGFAYPLDCKTAYLNANRQQPVSRTRNQHSAACLTYREGNYFVTQLNSTPVLINQQQLHQSPALIAGDTIQLPEHHYKFNFINVQQEF